MKIDGVLLDRAKQEYHSCYCDGTKRGEDGFKWSVSMIGGIVELGNGLLFVLEKPRIKTEFCFGYGQNGVADGKSFCSAVDASDGVREKQGFVNANLEMFDRDHGHLLGERLFYFRLRRNGRSNPVGIVRVSGTEHAYWCRDGVVSDGDRKRIVEEVGRMREDFGRRLEAYWRRYGSRCLKSWTYLVD